MDMVLFEKAWASVLSDPLHRIFCLEIDVVYMMSYIAIKSARGHFWL